MKNFTCQIKIDIERLSKDIAQRDNGNQTVYCGFLTRCLSHVGDVNFLHTRRFVSSRRLSEYLLVQNYFSSPFYFFLENKVKKQQNIVVKLSVWSNPSA